MTRIELSDESRVADLQRVTAVLQAANPSKYVTDGLLANILKQGSLMRVTAGATLIREGDDAVTEAFVLISGVLLVQSKSSVILRLDRPGEVVGEIAVINDCPRIADVVAESDSEVLAIPAEFFKLPETADIATVLYAFLTNSMAAKLYGTTENSRTQIDALSHEAATDPLTGLANRKHLDEALGMLGADSSDTVFSIIMVDLDQFKRYNDENGHIMGDAVLAKFAQLLKANVRRGDLAVRYGGEEFVLVLPDCDPDNAFAIAETIRQAVERETFPCVTGEAFREVTATFGVATFNNTGDAKELLKRADGALYQGKAGGRNIVVVAD